MRILLTGASGQVGAALLRTLLRLGEVIPADRTVLDLAKAQSIRQTMRDIRPDVVVNAAAYTGVDQAETDAEVAFAVNSDGPAVLAEQAAGIGALLVHFSTDYVFDGEKPTPYVETDAPNPLNVYGKSKLAGERAIAASGCRHLILRTSWVYSEKGRNFLLTILRLAREERPLRVVDDQRGAPTSSGMIAAAVPELIAATVRDPSRGGLYHMTASGSTTWRDFARAILEERCLPNAVTAIASADHPCAARRPRNSRLDSSRLARTFGIGLPDWNVGLRAVLAEMPEDAI